MSPSERLARHRIELQRALADGVSLAEARNRLARDAWRATEAVLDAKRRGEGAPGDGRETPFERAERPQPWMMRD